MVVKNANVRDELLTAQEVSEMLPDTSEQSVYRWARQGKLRAVVLPSGRKFFRREDIEKLLVPVVASSVSGDDVVLPGQGVLL